MALVSSVLEAQLLIIFKEIRVSETPMTDEQYANKLATAITNHILTAQVTGIGVGANSGGPISTTVTGTLS